MVNESKDIDAQRRSVREVLDKVKYKIDFFQREYTWERKHIEQLIYDLESKFTANYHKDDERKNVQGYGKYYLGSILLSAKDGNSIIDGQQRLTSISLLLIYLNHLQRKLNVPDDEKINIDDLIFSKKYGEKSFNLNVEDRKECFEALYNGLEFNPSDKGISVQNIVNRYNDLQEIFPEELKGKQLLFFIDWLIDNVLFVEIKTYSEDDAYTIFETMNDRGKNLTQTEMLKGYLLSKVEDLAVKHQINELWKRHVEKLQTIEKTEDMAFFRAWLRAKYAETIRPGKVGAVNEDFEKIANQFHSWVRSNKNKIGLNTESDFVNFVKREFDFFVKLYLKIHEAETSYKEGELEYIYYIHERDFTLHYPLLMAPIKSTDDEQTVRKKLELVARFIETFIVYRSVNFRTLAYSSIRYTMFSLVKEIRDKDIPELTQILKEKVKSIEDNLSAIDEFYLHQQNKRFIQYLLARITNHIERSCGMPSSFEDYVNAHENKKPFEIEHIWADKFEEHKDEFQQKDEFALTRNKLGALLLIPNGFNQSYGELPYESKLPHYLSQNLLAKTLNPQCYDHNPSFIQFKDKTGLQFKAHDHFKTKDIRERQTLYRCICEKIWAVEEFDKIANLSNLG